MPALHFHLQEWNYNITLGLIYIYKKTNSGNTTTNKSKGTMPSITISVEYNERRLPFPCAQMQHAHKMACRTGARDTGWIESALMKSTGDFVLFASILWELLTMAQ